MKVYIVMRYIDYAADIDCVDSVWSTLDGATKRQAEIGLENSYVETFKLLDGNSY